MVCLDHKDATILVEVELKLSNFLKHKHPIETVDCIICWNVDIEEYKMYKFVKKFWFSCSYFMWVILLYRRLCSDKAG